MCCMCLLFGSPKISVHLIGVSGRLNLKSCWVHSYTSDEELFCRRLVAGDKTWIYHWALLNIYSCSGRMWIAPHLRQCVTQPLTG